MNVITTNLSGVYVFEPKKFIDSRGYFMESYNKQLLKEYIGDINFVQDNESKSTYGVVRGLHFQKPPFAQAKLVRVVHGKVLDIAVDIRKGSPTFGQHFAIELSDENHRQLFIPRGFAHGFSVLSNEVVFQYKCDNYYQPSSEGAVLWNDSELNINWAIDNEHVILSDKDKNNSIFAELNSPFEF
ncbi:dTDP-4-dehydrorhamnose 3,5-epimerase [Bacteroides propionicifaciens]|uniref:dTDP-4-dehydrorhamnose 3,5-epimerase n=1 Tax=Bacteroides propionicifaciens TaxID=392838 RepID=UPI000368A9E1|nr:dTDP-4-dehydrorhamnose 3,5-epimerase [Bacteroides propionicifaciens]